MHKRTYFLPRHQKVLVHVGAQEARIAVTFHQLIDVVLSGEQEHRHVSLDVVRRRSRRRRGSSILLLC